jgi:hypothetical protein
MQPLETILVVTYNERVVTEIHPADPDWVVAFVNEYADAPRREAGEELDPYPPLEILGEHDPTLTAGLTKPQFVALADRLHGFFSASYEDEAVEVLNGLLEESAPVPRVRAVGDSYEVSWSVEGKAGEPLAAACALALLVELKTSRRFGVCEAERCVDVFEDRSPGGARRYCSARCHTRAKVGAFRRRKRDEMT